MGFGVAVADHSNDKHTDKGIDSSNNTNYMVHHGVRTESRVLCLRAGSSCRRHHESFFGEFAFILFGEA